MKTIVALVSLAVFAAILVPTVAPAEENGITLFSIGPVALDDTAILPAGPVGARWESNAMEGVSAGGLRPDADVYNGITNFGSTLLAGSEDSYDSGPDMDVHNGITAF
jgi:hypothetical protein